MIMNPKRFLETSLQIFISIQGQTFKLDCKDGSTILYCRQYAFRGLARISQRNHNQFKKDNYVQIRRTLWASEKQIKTKAAFFQVEIFCNLWCVFRYFNAPLSEDGTYPLEFWKAHSADYPILSAMTKDYMTIQASSVPPERAFSTGTNLVTADRCSLGGETVEKPQFLKFNL